MAEIVIIGISALLCVAVLCLISYLNGHKKGVEETVDFYNRVWKEAERRTKEAPKHGKDD